MAVFYLKQKEKRRKISVICVNDFHASLIESSSSLGGAKLVSAIRKYKSVCEGSVTVFGGDNYLGDPVSELLDGEPVTSVMRALDVRASVIGNHDFDFGTDALMRWQIHGEYKFVAANLIDRTTGNIPEFAAPYYMTQVGPLKVALIGLATKEKLDTPDRPLEMRNYQITDGVQAAHKWTEYLREGKDPAGKPDVIIALTHFGFKFSAGEGLEGIEIHELCKAVPQLDGAFAAHWHQWMKTFICGVPVAEGGSYGRGFAAIEIYLDDDGKIEAVRPDYIDLLPLKNTLKEDAAVKRSIADCFEKASKQMDEVIAVAEEDIPHRDPATGRINIIGSPLSRLATQAMLHKTRCGIALLYSGRMGSGFKKGHITRYQYYQTMRFANGLVTAELQGKDLLRNIETGMRTLENDGASPLAVDGIDVQVDMSKPQGRRVAGAAFPNGEPVEPERYYSVVMDDYIADDPLGFDFSNDRNRRYLNINLRQLLLEEICGHRLRCEAPSNITSIGDSSPAPADTI